MGPGLRKAVGGEAPASAGADHAELRAKHRQHPRAERAKTSLAKYRYCTKSQSTLISDRVKYCRGVRSGVAFCRHAVHKGRSWSLRSMISGIRSMIGSMRPAYGETWQSRLVIDSWPLIIR